MLTALRLPLLTILRLPLLALLLALSAAACTEVDRTVTSRGGSSGAIVWHSDRYGVYRGASTNEDCTAQARIGQPVPDACLTPAALAADTSAYERHPWPAAVAGLIVAALAVAFALRRVAWRPVVQSSTAGEAPPTNLDPDEAVHLMRGVAREKSTVEANAPLERDLRYPARTGAAAALVLMLPVAILIGYGATLGWAGAIGIPALVLLAFATVAFLTPLPPRAANPHVVVARLLFLGGFAGALALASFLGTLWRTAMLQLNGLPWLV